MLEDENLLNNIKLPTKEILKRINWFLKQEEKLREKYFYKGKDRNDFYEIKDIYVYNNHYYEKICKVKCINEYTDSLGIDGYYHTDTDYIDRPPYIGSNGVEYPYETIEGDFLKRTYFIVPKYLFSMSLYKVKKNLDIEYRNKKSKKYKEQKEQLIKELKETQEKINKLDDIIKKDKEINDEQ